MRTGDEYRRSLLDGRHVWMLGEGRIDDLTTHPLTRGMTDSYAAWYDRHFDPAWRDVLFTRTGADGALKPIAYEIPQTVDDLRRLGKAISQVSFATGGNMTHTPGYGALIALGLLDTLKAMDLSQAEIANASAYRDELARTGRFLTFSAGGAPLGFRFRAQESERAAIRIVGETAAGLIISGKVAMHTSSPFADDVFVAGGARRRPDAEHFTWFIIPVAAPGVRVIARKAAARHPHPSVAPLSHRYDELDAQLWLENVFIPWERVFTAETPLGAGSSAPADGRPPRTTNLVGWLLWHQHHGWLAKLEFSLGLALAGAEVMGYRGNPQAVEQLIDMLVDVQTARSCMVASECDPDVTDGGFLSPGQIHLASASLHTLRVRQRVTETLRRLPGSALALAPSLGDFDDPAMAADLEEALGGGGYTARQRAALLNLIWDNVSSSLDGRESVYEMHANGGTGAWRMRLRTAFKDYNQLANGALQALGIDPPPVDVSSLGVVQWPRAAPGGAVTAGAPQPPKLDPPADPGAAGRWLGESGPGQPRRKRARPPI